MTAMRYAYVIALVVWLGGMITIAAVVAPATFSALERVEPEVGRTRAATVVGEVLRRFHVVSYVAAPVLLATLGGMKEIGPTAIGSPRAATRGPCRWPRSRPRIRAASSSVACMRFPQRCWGSASLAA